jgi:hypothetical protein
VRPLLCALFLALCGAGLRAEAVSEDVPVPGGIAALCQALGLDPIPARSRFLTDLVRVMYDRPVERGARTDAIEPRFSRYLQTNSLAQASGRVPVPLSAARWRDILDRPVTSGNAFSTILTDRRAALLAYGLAALDDETLRFLDDRPAILTRLYQQSAASFSAFASGLRIRKNVIVVPGGEGAIALWEAVVGERVAEPERFLIRLFSQDEEHLSYLYHALAQFAPSSRAFVLGTWIPSERDRVQRFRSLVSALRLFPARPALEAPFRRQSNDPVLLFARVPVNTRGAPEGFADRAFWALVFDRDPTDGPIDAAWLAESILESDLRVRAERIDQLSFGLRVFAAPDTTAIADAARVLRAFPRYRMLMLTLERMGITNPAIYAAAAHRATLLSSLDSTDAFVALSQFQGTLALLQRLTEMRPLETAEAERLVASMAAVPFDKQGRYAGGMARWLERELAPAIGVNHAALDADLIASLAGASRPPPSDPTVVFEGRPYRIDLVTPELRRLSRALARLGAPPVGDALALAAIADRLSRPGLTLSDVRTAIELLKQLPDRIGAARAVEDLARISRANQAGTAKNVAAELNALTDDVLSEALLGLAYAMNVNGETWFARGNVSLRHDFGLGRPPSESRLRTPWVEPVEEFSPGVPWHVTGSILGLDMGLSALALRRIASDPLPHAPMLDGNQKQVFTKTVVLTNVFEMRDSDRDLIAAAVNRGRERVIRLRDPQAVENAADEIALDGWRRRALIWAAEKDPANVLSLFSLAELFHLGQPAASAGIERWGVATSALDGCQCTAIRAPGGSTLLSGRWPNGAVATQVADLSFRIALALSELRLPAALSRHVLAAATQDFVDRVRPLYPDDWLTLALTAQALSTATIEDYVAALTVDGPLVADIDAEGDR